MLLVERERFGEEMERQVKARTAELSESTADLQALAARLQLVREEERTALARELHDEFGQNLTALQFDVNWIGCHLQAAKPIDVAAIQNRVSAMAPLAKRLTELTKVPFSGLASYNRKQRAKVSFDRPELSPCLTALPDKTSAVYLEALGILRAGGEALTKRPRGDMPGFQACPVDEGRDGKYAARQQEEARFRTAIVNGKKAYDPRPKATGQ